MEKMSIDSTMSHAVLDQNRMAGLKEIVESVKNEKAAHCSLFYGSGEKEKKMAAALVGTQTGMDVYHVNVSSLISKYTPETAKSLSTVFDEAQARNYILFLDEADALFAKRTTVRDAHDKYANQAVALILQKAAAHTAPLILSTNTRGNIDDPFIRRLHSVIAF